MKRPDRESGNIFFMLFAAVAVVGVLGAVTVKMMRGPLNTMVEVNRRTAAESQIAITSKLGMMTSALQANSGDCETTPNEDGYVEPMEWVDASGAGPDGVAGSEGGGWLPDEYGVTKKDPWGSNYGYCVWDAGPVVNDPGCGGAGQKRLQGSGTDYRGYPVIAIISAGPDRTFQTGCEDFATADTNSNGTLDSTEKMVVKASGSDDIVMQYTYAEASVTAGGLWELKSGSPDTAVTAKNVEIGGTATFTGGVTVGPTGSGDFPTIKTDIIQPLSPTQPAPEFTAGLMLSNAETAGNACLNTELGALAMDAATPTQLLACLDNSGTSEWVTIGGANFLWQEGATAGEIYYNTGNVGIGTNDPNLPLDVVGDAGLTGDLRLTDTHGVLWGDGTTSVRGSGPGTLTFLTGGATRLTVDSSGLVGIGVAPAASTRLTVQGTGTSGATAGLNVTDSAGAPVLTARDNAQVGIGNAAPNDALDVTGSVDATADYKIDGNVVLYVPDGVDENILVGKAAGAGVSGNNNAVLGASAAASLGGGTDNLVAGQASAIALDGGSFNTVLGQGAGSSLVSGDRNILIGASDSTPIDVPAAGTSDYLNIGNTIFGDLANDYIGIGVAAPNDALDVAGNIDATGNINTGGNFTINSVVFGPAQQCTSAQKLQWSNASGWSCVTDLNDGSSGTPQDLESVLTAGNDANTLTAVNLGGVAIGSNTLSTGGTQNLVLDVTGAVGADWYCDADGNNCFDAASVGSIDTFLELTDTPANYTGAGYKAVMVNPTGSGLQFSDTSALLLPDGTDAQRPGTAANGMIRYNSTANKFEVYENGAWKYMQTGTSTGLAYTDLSDTPAVYTGAAYKLAMVNPTETGMIFSYTDAVLLPSGTTAERPGTATNGMIRYNGTNNKFEAYQNGAWVNLITSGAGSALAIDDLTDAQTDYATDHNLIMGRPGATALTTGAAGNVFIGEGAGATTANSTATTDQNTAVGYHALQSLTTGGGNTASGAYALLSNTTGINNTASGSGALEYNTTGSGNTASGNSALYNNTTGNGNTASGSGALVSNKAKSNSTAVGYQAMYYANDTTTAGGANNTAVGYNALMGSATAANNTGTNNLALGYNALLGATSGGNNVAVGASAGDAITTGSNNIVIGYNVDTYDPTASNVINIGDTIYGDLSTDQIRIGGSGALSGFSNLEVTGTLALTLPGGTTAQRPGTPAGGMFRYNTTATPNDVIEYYDAESAAWIQVPTSASGGAPLSGISAALADNTIANGGWNQTWNWALTGATEDAFTFGETTAATGGSGDQSVLKATTLASSTAVPLMVTNLGDGLSLRINDETGDDDTTPVVVTATGQLGVGATAPGDLPQTWDGGGVKSLGVKAFIQDPDSGIYYANDGYRLNAYHFSFANNSWSYPTYTFGTAKTSQASPTAVSDGDVLGELRFSGYDGNYMTLGAAIRAEVSGTPALSEVPSRLVFSTATNGDTNPIERMRITNTGDVTMSGTGALKIHAGTTAERPGTGVNGMIRYNSTTNKFEGYQNGSWQDILTGSGGVTKLDDLTDAQTDYATDHNLIMGRAGATALAAGAQQNVFIGEGAGATTANSTSATDSNTAVGYQALTSLTTGSNNTASGVYSLYTNTTGSYNTANGSGALTNNTTGSNNGASGYLALNSNTTGSNNTASGSGALQYNTTGNGNAANGAYALFSNTTGSTNTASGSGALTDNTTGNYNTASGNAALSSNVAKSNSTAVGYYAMRYADDTTTPGNANNTALGYQALRGSTTAANNTGLENTAVGANALLSNTTGNDNTASGASTLEANTTGSNNTASGYSALWSNTTGGDNTASGSRTLFSNTTGTQNTASGVDALRSNVAKSNSTAVGYYAMRYADDTATPGNANNTALGYQALMGSGTAANNTGTDNTAIGAVALQANTTGSKNVAVGKDSLGTNTTGGKNTAVGWEAGKGLTTTSDNTAIGYWAMSYQGGSVTGTRNSSLGSQTMFWNQTGDDNVALGYRALYANTSGSGNTAIGKSALVALTTGGTQNTVLGFQAGDSITTGTGNLLLGYDVDTPAATTSNFLNIGDTIYGDLSTDQIRIGGSGALSGFSNLEVTGTLALTLPGGTTAQRPGTPAGGMFRYNTTATPNDVIEYYDAESAAWIQVPTSASGGAPLSGISAALADNTIANGGWNQTWNWALTGATEDAFTFGETTAATGGSGDQSVLKATTLASSTAVPLMVTNLGDGLSLRINDETGDDDTTPVVVTATGQLGVGATAPGDLPDYYWGGGNWNFVPRAYVQNANGGVYFADDAGNGDVYQMAFNDLYTGEVAPSLYLSRARGTQASPSIVTDGDALGYVNFAGYDGVNEMVAGASIEALVDGTPGNNDMPTSLNFMTTPDGSGTPTTRMVISESGNITMSGTGALKIHAGTTAERPGTGVNGMIRYNSTTNKFEGYQNGSWQDILTGSGGVTKLDDLTDAKTDYTTDHNLLIGTPADAWAIAAGGQYNLTLGETAGDSITTGDRNVAMGYGALTTGATMTDNIAIGYNALTLNQSGGTDNVAIGSRALDANTTGNYNVAIGTDALGNHSLFGQNVAIGYQAMAADASGLNNVALGYQALANVSHDESTAIGSMALSSATNGKNTALGYQAGNSITTGQYNLLLGYDVDTPAATTSNFLNIGDTIFGDLANDRIRIGGSGAVGAFNDLELAGTLALKVSAGTTAERPGTPTNGMIRYNSTTNLFEAYQNGAWTNMIGSGLWTDSGSGYLQYTNSYGGIKIGNVTGQPAPVYPAGGSGGGSSTFVDLTDTPSAFTSAGYKVVKVNAGASALEFGGTDALLLPSGTDAQRPGTPTNGMIRYNSTSGNFEGYQSGAWGAIAGSSIWSDSGSGYIEYSNALGGIKVGSVTGAAAPTVGYALDDLSDVSAVSPALGDTVVWDGTSSWTKASGLTSTIRVPSGTTAQRPGTAANGMIRYNSTLNKFEAYENGAWTNVIGGGSSLWTDNTTHISRGTVRILNAGQTMTSAGLDGGTSGLIWHEDKKALRVGEAGGVRWNEANIGSHSVAMGRESWAIGQSSVAIGEYAYALDGGGVAIGWLPASYGVFAVGIGHNVIASGDNSTSLGADNRVNGTYSMGIGLGSVPGTYPLVSGNNALGIFMGDHSNINFAAANTMGVFGGKMVIDPAVPATQLTARGVIDAGAATDAIVFPSGTTAQRPGTPVNGMIRYNSTLNKFEAYENGAWTNVIGGGGSSVLSSITAATGTNTIASGDNAQVWNWALTTATKDAFTFGETTAATGGSGDQSVLKATTLASSTAVPLMVTNLGDGASFRVNDETGDSDTTPFMIDADGNVGINYDLSGYYHSILNIAQPGGSGEAIRWGPPVVDSNTLEGTLGYDGGSSTVIAHTNNADFLIEVSDVANNRSALRAAAASGYVLIGQGTPVPGALLHTNATDTTGNSIIEALRLSHEDTNSAAANGVGAAMTFNLETATNNTFAEAARIAGVWDDATNNSKDGSLRFYTMGPNAASGTTTTTERMRIDSSGNVGIGTASPAATLDVSSTDSVLLPRGTTAQRPGTPVNGMIRYNSTTNAFEAYENGAWVAMGASVSDIRLKKDIKPLDRAEIVAKLMQVDTYSFRLKNDATGRENMGVIAQEIEKIFPDLVDGEGDEMKSVHYVELIAPLIETGKYLKAENDNLRTDVNDLKEQVALLNKSAIAGTGKASMDGWMMLIIGLALGGNLAFFLRGDILRRKRG